MLESIIRGSMDIVARADRLIDKATSLIVSGNIDDFDADQVQKEIERLTDVVFVLEEVTRFIQRTFEQKPEMARRYSTHATLQ